jgi:hypothetical protein
MGRIKELEALLRKHVSDVEKRLKNYTNWEKLRDIADPEEQTKQALFYTGHYSGDYGHYVHPRTGEEGTCLYSWLSRNQEPERITAERQPISGAEAVALFFAHHSQPEPEDEWSLHYRLRLAYEAQMIEAAGGRAAFVEMEVGGWIGKHQIRKVNKSCETGRVVSVTLKLSGDRWGNSKEGFHLRPFNIERLPEEVYRPPTPEDLAALAAEQKTEKAAKPKVDCPLINPTHEDAQKLQDLWNAKQTRREYGKPSQILVMSQERYSANSGGTYSRYETVTINEHGHAWCDYHRMNDPERSKVFKVRTAPSGEMYGAARVVVIEDKPQKPLPWNKMKAERAKHPTAETMREKLPAIMAALSKGYGAWDEDRQLLQDASYVGWVNIQSMTQIYWTEAGAEAFKTHSGSGQTIVAHDSY